MYKARDVMRTDLVTIHANATVGSAIHTLLEYDISGAPVVDDGFKAMAQRVYDWHQDGTMSNELWGSVSGSTYRGANEEFANAQVVMYMSGSWQIGQFTDTIGDGILHYAARMGDAETVKLLLKMPKIDRNARNIAGETAYDIAMRWQRPEIAQLLK